MEGALPQGWIGYLTLWFSVIGIFTWLLNYFNAQFSKSASTSVFTKYFFRLLTIPVILLSVAIVVRYQEYGLTENRYIVAALAVWLAILTIIFGWAKNRHIKFIPFSLAILTLISIFGGPLDMFSTSLKNQAKKLETLMQEHQIIQNGKLNLTSVENVPDSIKYELREGIIALADRCDLSMVDDWVENSIFEEYKDGLQYEKRQFLMKKLGLDGAIYRPTKGRRTKDNYFNISISGNESINVEGYSQMHRFNLSSRDNLPNRNIKIVNDHEILIPPYGTYSLAPIINKVPDEEYNVPISEMTIIMQDSISSIKLIIEQISGQRKGQRIIVESGQGWILEQLTFNQPE